MLVKLICRKPTGKGLAAIYRQEIIQDVTLFTSQSAAMFYDKLFSSLDFTLPRAATGRRGFPKEAMVCAFIVMKCEGFSQITDLVDYLDNNRIIAHYCGFNIMEPLPSYWTYDRCLRQLNNGALKSIMANLVRKLYELGVVDASFVGLDSTPVMANTKQNNPKSFAKNKFSKENHPKSDPDCALGVHSASNQHNERRYEFYWGYKSHVLVDCISGLPLYELTTPGNVADSSVGFAMHKDGKTTNNGRTRQKYCCPFRQSKTGVCPCNHKNWNNGKKNRGCVKYRIVPTHYRLSIDRSCLCFKRTYALRTECERYNSRFKSTGQERLWVRNGTSAANLNTLAHISALTVALAAVLHGSHSYRSAKQLRRSA